MTERPHIVPITKQDLKLLQTVSIQTFTETFADVNTEENMSRYLQQAFNPNQLLRELSNENSRFYFARMKEQVIGYLKLNFGPAQTEIKDENTIEIERIYVLKAFQRNRVGKLLYQKAIDVATKARATKIWLGVWEKNEKALNFYKKNGFILFDKHIFRLGNDEQTDLILEVKLDDRYQ